MEKLPVRLLLAASMLLVLAGALWGLRWRSGPARPCRGLALSAAVPPRHCTFRAMKNKHLA